MTSKHSVTPIYRPLPLPGVGLGSPSRRRDRTPMEVITDGYMAEAQVAALNAVTQFSMESVRQCDLKRQEVLAEHPNLEAPIVGLLMNHVRLLAEVQSRVANNDRRR